MKSSVITLLFLSVVCMPMASFAAEWEISADLSLNVTQNAYSDNWTGGEAGAISWVSLANISAQKQLSEKYHWKNTGKFGFGQTHQQDVETKDWKVPEKSTDKIDIESVLKITLDAFVDPYIAERIESQFLDNSEPKLKRLFNPILFTTSAGASKTIYKKDKDEILTRVGLAIRNHMNRVVADTINFDKTETETLTDGGLEWVTDVKYTITPERFRYEGKLSIFQAFFNSKSDDLKGLENEDYWRAPDINWENLFTASVSKYVQVTLYIQWLYDKEIDKGGRFKESLAMGLTYKLF
ncbi:MAG: DUF3078 domain-containing protein [candidate division Zixibacteria bacterium]|nr:DUF3078 domain-containing protein [candidate division Zixibacteria bacterium]